MKAFINVAVAISVFVGNVHCNSVPFITPCHASDSTCLLSSAQRALPTLAAGVPALGVAPMDPMHVGNVTATQAGLEMSFMDTVVRGLRHCRVNDIHRDGPNMSIELQCSVVLTGHYQLSGQLLIFPIQGHGRYKIIIRDIVVRVDLETNTREANGQSFWLVRSWRHSVHVLTSVVYRFENLFNGDQSLADPVERYANENWRDIFTEVSPPIVKEIVARIVRQTAQLFKRVPIADLALD